MMNTNQYKNAQKIKFLDLQLLATLGFIFALIISYILSYDKKLSLENKKRLFTNEEVQNLSFFQTILVLVISLCFLYVNYKQYIISKQTNDRNELDFLLQIETSIFAIISALIGVYIVCKNHRNKNITIANKEIL